MNLEKYAIKGLFHELKQLDKNRAPLFADVCEKSRDRGEHPEKIGRRHTIAPVVILTVLAFIAFWMIPKRPSDPYPFSGSRSASTDFEGWHSPTDALLGNTGLDFSDEQYEWIGDSLPSSSAFLIFGWDSPTDQLLKIFE